MGIKHFIFHASLIGCMSTVVGSSWAEPSSSQATRRVGLIDARLPSAAVAIGETPAAGTKLRFFRLSSTTRRGVECCVKVGNAAATTELLLYQGSETLAAPASAATVSSPVDEGFIGLALMGQGVRVRRLSEQKLSVSWSHLPGKVVVEHCLSQEGIHVRLSETSHPDEPVHYYLPLGMDVEANCPASMTR
jgi:hypothetical protein